MSANKLKYATFEGSFFVFMGKTNKKNRRSTNCSICTKKSHKIQGENNIFFALKSKYK
jgi:hypothetical protein